MSKYGWGWILKSWFSPIGMVRRMLGYVPVEDKSTEVDTIKWRFCVLPVLGFSAKEMVKDGNKIFGQFFDKDFINQSVKDYIDASRDGDFFDIYEHFMFEISPDEREELLKQLGRGKSWKVVHDEYKETMTEAEWKVNFHRRRGNLLSLVEQLAQHEKLPTKEAVAEEIRKASRDVYDCDECEDDGCPACD